MKRYMTSMMFIMALMLLGDVPSLAAQEKIVLSIDEDASYFADWISQKVLQEAYSRLGIPVEFQRLPRERAIRSADNGATDGIDARLPGLEQQYPNLIMVSVPITSIEAVVITKDKTFEVKGWESVAPYTIGLVRGTKLVEQRTQGMKAEAATTLEQALRKLEANRTDIVIHTRDALCEAKKLGFTDLKVLEPPLEQVKGYHYLNKTHQALQAKLADVFTQMTQEQAMERLKHDALLEWLKSCE